MTDNRTQHPNIIPRTPLEAHLLAHREIRAGFRWSSPSIGHPEKNVGFHVAQVLQNIDSLVQVHPISKERFRIAAIVHDSFKYKENRLERQFCHGMLARKFMENYSNDLFLLELLEWHDEAYRAWRIAFFQNNFALSGKKIQALIRRFGSDILEYQQFFNCDSKMMDKRIQPIQWLDNKIKHQQKRIDLKTDVISGR